MANELARLFVTLNLDDSDLQKKLKTVQRSMGELSKIALVTGGAIVAGFGLAVKSAEEERVNIARLSTALKNVGISYDAVSVSLEKVIRATMRKTGVADDEQRDILGRLVLVTNDYNAALSLLPVTLDLAAAGEMDSTTAATRLGKAWTDLQGGARNVTIQLGRTSIVVKDLAELQQKLAGSAAAAASPMTILKNTVGDLQESIGSLLLPTVKGFVDLMVPVVAGSQEWIELNPKLAGTLSTVAGALGLVALGMGGIGLAVPKIAGGFTVLGKAAGLLGGFLGIGAGGVAAGLGLLAASAIPGVIQMLQPLNKEFAQLGSAVSAGADSMTKTDPAWNALIGNAKAAHEEMVKTGKAVQQVGEVLTNAVAQAIAHVSYQLDGATMQANLFTEAEIRQQEALGRVVTRMNETKDATEAQRNVMQAAEATWKTYEDGLNAAIAAHERLETIAGRSTKAMEGMRQSIATASWVTEDGSYSTALYTEAEIAAAEAAGRKIERVKEQTAAINETASSMERANAVLRDFQRGEGGIGSIAGTSATALEKLVAQYGAIAGFGASADFVNAIASINLSAGQTNPAEILAAYLRNWQIANPVPSYAVGGPVKETGLAMVHRNEYITPAGAAPNVINNYITVQGSIRSDRDFGEWLRRYLMQVGRQNVTAGVS